MTIATARTLLTVMVAVAPAFDVYRSRPPEYFDPAALDQPLEYETEALLSWISATLDVSDAAKPPTRFSLSVVATRQA